VVRQYPADPLARYTSNPHLIITECTLPWSSGSSVNSKERAVCGVRIQYGQVIAHWVMSHAAIDWTIEVGSRPSFPLEMGNWRRGSFGPSYVHAKVIAGFIFYICPFTESSQERDLAGLRVQISEIHLHWRCRRRWMWFILNGARPSHLEISIILNAIRQMAARNTPRWRHKPPPESLG